MAETTANAKNAPEAPETVTDTLRTRMSLSLKRGATVEPSLSADVADLAAPLPGKVPTDEQLSTLRHVADSLPLSAWLVVLAELSERFAFYGISAPLQNYSEFPYPSDPSNPDQRGGLGLGQSTATALNLFFTFLCYVSPIAGAIISDIIGLGKFRTIFYFCFVYLAGLAILVGTSVPPLLATSTQGALAGLIIAMIVVGFATGAIKSNVSPFVADQYPHKVPFVRERAGGDVVVDPTMTTQSIYNYFYLAINIGSLCGIFAATYAEKYVGFWLAYLIPSLVFLVTIVVLFTGWRTGTIKADKPKRGSSVLVDAWRVVRESFGRFRGDFEACAAAVASKTAGKPAGHTGEAAEATALHTEGTNINATFVRDVGRALSACKVFVFFPVYWVVYSQITNNLVSQAATMDTGGVPNDVIVNLDPLFVICAIPIFDKVVYPGLRRCGIALRPVGRISLGFLFAAVAMAWSAYVQQTIYDAAAPNSVSVWMQIPAYFFIACSEVFASITGLEFAYSRAPASMKSVVMALFLLTSAFGSALGFALVPVSQDPYLTWMYGSLAIVAGIVGVLLYIMFRGLDKEDAEKERREVEAARNSGDFVADEAKAEAELFGGVV
ncbi:MFS peptide transporter [Hyaloraphidium curvatum]|nr:MFS peptide transporter [Hyaloraphidium curvatum]